MEHFRVVRGCEPVLYVQKVTGSHYSKSWAWNALARWSTREEDALLWSNRLDADSFARLCSIDDDCPYAVERVDSPETHFAISHDLYAPGALVRETARSKNRKRISYRGV
jgi:hypothetical protein